MNNRYFWLSKLYQLRCQMFFVKWFLYWAFMIDGLAGVVTFGNYDPKMVTKYRVWVDSLKSD